MTETMVEMAMAQKKRHTIEGLTRIIHFLIQLFRRKPISPDYVQCPHCHEPEVEIWYDDRESSCHNCGKTIKVNRK